MSILAIRQDEDYKAIPLEGTIFIESAAGTGKTYTLENFHLRLLKEKNLTINDILVVTFTKAATQELKGRIQKEIYKACENNSHLEKAYNSFHQAQIFTIDEFVKKTLQEYSFECEIDGSFVVEEESQMESFHISLLSLFFIQKQKEFEKNILLQKGYKAFFHKVPQSNEVSFQETIKKLIKIFQELSSDVQPLTLFLSQPESQGIKALWMKQHNEDLKETFEKFRKTVIKNLDAVFEERQVKENFDMTKSKCLKKIREILKNFSKDSLWDCLSALLKSENPVESNIDKTNSWSILSEFCQFPEKFLKKNRSLPSEFYREEIDVYYNQLVKELGEVTKIFRKPLAQTEIDILTLWLIWSFVEYTLSNYKKDLIKIQNHQERYSFQDALQILIQQVHKDPSLKKTLSQRYKAILIDEFQDTNAPQWHLFSKILKGETTTLFLIGDPKQSIYAFRGAEMLSFYKAKEDIRRNLNSYFYYLPINRRSHHLLVENFNKMFQILFSKKSSIFQQESYSLMESSTKNLSESVNYESPIVFTSSEASQTEYYFLIELEKFLKKPEVDITKCAILSRTRSELKNTEYLIKKYKLNIPYCLYNSQNLLETLEYKETINFLESLIKPQENLDSLLFSEFIKFPLEVVLWIKEEKNRSLRYEISTKIQSIVENFLKKRVHFLVLIKNLEIYLEELKTKLLPFLNLSSLEQSLFMTTFEERLIILNQTERLSIFREIFDWISPFLISYQKIENCIEDIDKGIIKAPKLFSQPDSKVIHLMTIHRSKGLQFDHVFILTNKQFPPNTQATTSTNLWYSFYHENSHVYDFFKEKVNTQDHLLKLWQEEKHLLYVAITRAQKTVSFVWEKKKTKTTKSYIEIFFNIILNNPQTREDLINCIKNPIQGKILESKIQDSSFFKLVNLQETSNIIFPYHQKRDIPYKNSSPGASPQFHEKPDAKTILQKTLITFSFSSLVKKNSERNDEPLSFTENLSFLPKGAFTGNWIHRIFQEIDFCSLRETENPISWLEKPFLKNEKFSFKKGKPLTVYEKTLEILQEETPYIYHQEQIIHEALVMIWNVLKTPLPFVNISLSETNPKKTLKEHSFLMRIKPIKDFTNNFSTLEPFLKDSLKSGYLTGILDCIVEIGGKIYIIDWKTNFLGNTWEDYHQENISRIMSDQGYYLQYHLYLLALYVWHKKNSFSQSMEETLGGVFYIFTRAFLNFNSQLNQKNSSGIFYASPDFNLLNELTNSLIPELS